jgi:hypothetical protein
LDCKIADDDGAAGKSPREGCKRRSACAATWRKTSVDSASGIRLPNLIFSVLYRAASAAVTLRAALQCLATAKTGGQASNANEKNSQHREA